MKNNDPITLITKALILLIISIITTLAVAFVLDVFISTAAPDLQKIEHYHSFVFIPLISFLFAIFFILGGVLIFPFPPLTTAIILAIVATTLKILDLYELSVVTISGVPQTTNIPLYASLAGSFIACSITLIVELARKGTRPRRKRYNHSKHNA